MEEKNVQQIINTYKLQLIVAIVNVTLIDLAVIYIMPKIWPTFPKITICILVAILPLINLIDLLLFIKFKNLKISLLRFIIFDGLILTTILYLCGELRYLFFFIYLVPIMMAAPIFSLKQHLFLPIIYSLFFIIMVYFEYIEILNYINTPKLRIANFYIWISSIVVIIILHAVTIFLGKVMDERRKMDEELKIAYKKLKDSQAKLIKAEKRSAIVQIAQEAAHEIKNPLTVIKSGFYYLKTILDIKETKALETMKMIEKAVLRAIYFIDELLDLSKPFKLVKGPVNVNELIKKVITEQLIKNFSEVEVIEELSDRLLLVDADLERLKQVIAHLLTNALEAMREKEKNRRLIIKSKKEREYIKIEISDTGKGISKEDLSKIFDPFYTTKGKGIGLGLAICKKIINAHKGKIEVDSKEGEGTKFTISLPYPSI